MRWQQQRWIFFVDHNYEYLCMHGCLKKYKIHNRPENERNNSLAWKIHEIVIQSYRKHICNLKEIVFFCIKREIVFLH